MSKSVVFPYGITLKEDGRIDIFPVAEVTFFTREGEALSLVLVIDSGASVSALPRSDAAFLGILAEGGAPMIISGVGGDNIRGWQHKLSVKLGKETLAIPIVFLDHQFAPRVLGREGVFDNFILIFEESKRRTGFVKEATREAKAIQKVLARLSN